jgi:hypothetical protein
MKPVLYIPKVINATLMIWAYLDGTYSLLAYYLVLNTISGMGGSE